MMDIVSYFFRSGLEGWLLFLALIFVLAEAIYLYLISTQKRGYKTNLTGYSISVKFFSLFFSFVVFVVIWAFTTNLKIMVAIFTSVVIVIVYFIINYYFAKWLNKQETEKEFLRKVYEYTDFRIGDKVRVRTDLVRGAYKDRDGDLVYDNNDGDGVNEVSKGKMKLAGKTLVVDEFSKRANVGAGDFWWTDEMIEKVKPTSRTKKKR